MDALSKFLSLHTISTTLDFRCELNAPWRLVNEGSALGTAAYHLVTEGNARLEVAGAEDVDLSAGDMVMFPRGTAHILHAGDKSSPTPELILSGENSLNTLKIEGPGAKAEILCGEFVFDALASSLLIQSLPDTVLIRTHEKHEHQRLHQLMLMLKKETQENLPGAQIVIQHLASTLFSLFIRSWAQETKLSVNLLRLLTEPRLYPAVQCILSSPGQAWTLEQLASQCFMSRATFIRAFKQVTGQSPGGFLTVARLLQATQMLTKSKISINKICEMVGYSSEPAFHRIFKQRMGMTPGEFRRKRNDEAD
jgi:AraC family transcriptional activator of mtrCDE